MDGGGHALHESCEFYLLNNEQFRRESHAESGLPFLHLLREAGVSIQTDSDNVRGASIQVFPRCWRSKAIRILFGDYSWSDLVVSTTTTLPRNKIGAGDGSAAIKQLLMLAEASGLTEIRATQAQEKKL